MFEASLCEVNLCKEFENFLAA